MHMAGASTSVYEADSMVKGQHVYEVYGLYSLTSVVKLVSVSGPVQEDDEYDKYAINNRL